MAAKKRRSGRYQEEQPRTALYIDGNTVREVEYVEDDWQDSEREVDYRVKRNRDKARSWTMPYVIMLLAATAVTMVICVQFLRLQSNITLHQSKIADLQAELATAKTANDAAEADLSLYTDLDHIYDVAVNEYGMVYPSDDQVIEYDKSESEYVRQYDEIPTEN